MKFRYAKKEDLSIIVKLIKDLAEYEDMIEHVIFDEEELSNWLFEENMAKVIFIMKDDVEAGFALFFYNFSTFKGKPGLYIEDLFIIPEYRGKGYGIALIKELGRIAIDKKLSRLEWACLDWNKSSIDFYLAIGADRLDDRRTYRLDDDQLINLI